MAGLPQPLPCGLVLLEFEPRAPRPRRVRAPPLRRARRPPPCPSTRGEEGWGEGALVGVHRLNGAGVDQLDTPDLHPGPDHGDRSTSRPLDVREDRLRREDALRDGIQAQDHLREHAKGAFGADEEGGQVVPAEDFIAIPPVRITVPLASTTSRPRTWSRIAP